MMMDNIKPCMCKSDYQDQRYGIGMRVHTELKKVQGEPQRYSCTVCGINRRKERIRLHALEWKPQFGATAK